MTTDFDRWVTTEPDECIYCGRRTHADAACPERRAEVAEEQAERQREEARRLDWPLLAAWVGLASFSLTCWGLALWLVLR